MIFSEISSEAGDRDLEKNYDAPEAHDILRKQHLIKSLLGFSEELPCGDGVYT